MPVSQGATQLRTPRDQRLQSILLEAAQENSDLLLAEKNARRNDLLTEYTKTLQQQALLFRINMDSVSSFNTTGAKASGLFSQIEGVFQFAANWQTDFRWSSGQNLTLSPTIIRETQSEIPGLDFLTITYGRHRSVEASLGLFDDEPVFRGKSPQPLFSGVEVKLHPLSQSLYPQTPQFEFILEHGWNNLRNESSRGPARSQIQRTRPRILAKLSTSNWNLLSGVGVEWYSDKDAILGKIIAQRNIGSETQRTLTSVKAETRWRLFTFSLSSKLDLGNGLTTSLFVERASNSIGQTSFPALNAGTEIQKSFSYSENFMAQASVRFFEIPSGSVPQSRLPLENSPGTRGSATNISLSWTPSTSPNVAYTLFVGRISETTFDAGGWNHCQSKLLSQGQETKSRCTTGWGQIRWTMQLPPNL